MWTSKWPTKVGCYLFFGDFIPRDWVSARNGIPTAKPKYAIVYVWETSQPDSLAYVGNGRFFYKSDTVGLFRPLDEAFPETWET